MVNYAVSKSGSTEDFKDIFHAAATDNVSLLALCLQRGDRLDDVDRATSFTPIHLAIVEGSDNFLRAAMEYEFDPWIRDANLRLPIDHAAALGLKDIQRSLHQKMYPEGWRERLQVSDPKP